MNSHNKLSEPTCSAILCSSTNRYLLLQTLYLLLSKPEQYHWLVNDITRNRLTLCQQYLSKLPFSFWTCFTNTWKYRNQGDYYFLWWNFLWIPSICYRLQLWLHPGSATIRVYSWVLSAGFKEPLYFRWCFWGCLQYFEFCIRSCRYFGRYLHIDRWGSCRESRSGYISCGYYLAHYWGPPIFGPEIWYFPTRSRSTDLWFLSFSF